MVLQLPLHSLLSVLRLLIWPPTLVSPWITDESLRQPPKSQNAGHKFFASSPQGEDRSLFFFYTPNYINHAWLEKALERLWRVSQIFLLGFRVVGFALPMTQECFNWFLDFSQKHLFSFLLLNPCFHGGKKVKIFLACHLADTTGPPTFLHFWCQQCNF